MLGIALQAATAAIVACLGFHFLTEVPWYLGILVGLAYFAALIPRDKPQREESEDQRIDERSFKHPDA